MDLEKLIASQSRLAAETPSAPEGRPAGGDVVNRPIELQQAQADRVKNRIESLEKSKAALIESIDVELRELKGDYEARTRKIEADSKSLEAAANALAAASAPGTGKAAKAARKARKTTRASSAKASKPR